MNCTGHPRAAGEHDAAEFDPSRDGIGVCPVCGYAQMECGMPGCHNAAERWEISPPLDKAIRVSAGGSLLTPYEAIPICGDCSPRVASGEKPDGVIAVPQLTLIHNVEQI